MPVERRPFEYKPGDEFFANGTVLKVKDGDTLILKLSAGARILDNDDDGLVDLRFSAIDTPESAYTGLWPEQPFSKEAREFARAMLEGKVVTARMQGDLTYGRFVGEVFVDGRSANRELVRAGLAWWYKAYDKYDLDYERLEQSARAAKVGLWQHPNPVPPWRWRQGVRG